MAELKVKHNNVGTAITITLASLADAAYRQSAVVDNTTNLYVDALVGGSIQVGTSPTANNAIYVYAYGQYGGSGEYTAGASGSDAAYTADGEQSLLRLVKSILVDATSNQDYEFGPVAIAPLFGGHLPPRWGIVVLNSTGAALNATGTNNEIVYTGITYTNT